MNGERRNRGPRRYVRMLVVLAVVAVVIVLALRWRQPEAVAVTVAEVRPGRVESTVSNTRAGTVNACRRAKLAPPAGGQIVRLPVKKGDRVRAGDLLLELWNEDAAAQVRAADEQLQTARLRADEACVRAETAEREAQRAQRLWDEGLIPEERYDRLMSESRTLQRACAATRSEVETSQARVQVARATLSRTALRAPFSGIVADIRGELGEFTTPSPPGIPTPPAVDLIDDSCLYVSAPIDEVDAPNVRVGLPGHISLDAFPGRRFAGQVRRVAPYVLDLERQARTVEVEVEFEDAGEARHLLVGYSADVEIVLEERGTVLRVPTQALLEGRRVLVVNGQGVLEERRLETGISNWEYTEVLNGLSAGDEVVLSVEREGVRPGAKARVESRRTEARR